MFWGLTFICEEYCVPAITVFCKRNNISDDIAGAIFIGTGLSLPVLFASFVGLFISNSAIGVGTVVGGDIFNHLINIAISIQTAPGKTLKLDGVVFTREVIFYFISCIFVIWAAKGNLSTSFTSMFEKEQWLSCLSIHWIEALVLVLCYVAYCVIDAYFSVCLDLFSKYYLRWWKFGIMRMMYQRSNRSDIGSDVEVVDIEQFESSIGDDNNHTNGVVPSMQNDDRISVHIPTDTIKQIINHNSHNQPNHHNVTSTDPSSSLSSHVAQLPRPVIDIETLNSQTDEPDLSSFSMYLFSSFYGTYAGSCIPTSRAWKIRYCSLDNAGLYYRCEDHLPKRGPHVRFIDIFDLESVDIANSDLLEFHIRLKQRQKRYYFRAVDQESFAAVITRLTNLLHELKKRNESELRAISLKSRYAGNMYIYYLLSMIHC
jgi:hypothetical protein